MLLLLVGALSCIDDDAAIHYRLTVYDASGKVLVARDGGYCRIWGDNATRGQLYVVGGTWDVSRPMNGALVCEPIP